MDLIKEAFQKAKKDIEELKAQLAHFSYELSSLKSALSGLQHQTHVNPSNTNQQTNKPTNQQTQRMDSEGLITQNNRVSIGNDGVPTNKPTNQQTNQHPPISTEKFALNKKQSETGSRLEQIRNIREVVNSLDSLRKELRSKFKRLTNQEMLIFSTLYQLDESGFIVDYSLLSEQTKLTEISIRDYIRKLINKGIPIEKTKHENNKILLKIPEDFKKIASLSTINSLREL